MAMKGVFYVADAIIFSAILLGLVLVFPATQQPEPIQYPSTLIASDIINVLEELQVKELDPDWVAAQLADGNITDENLSILVQLGSLWAQDNIAVANQILNDTINNVIPLQRGFGFYVNDEAVFARTQAPTARYTSSWRIVSGVEKTRPLQGFIANAKATSAIINSTKVYTLSPLGSGWEDGYLHVTRYLNLSNITINNAILRMSVHADRQDNDIQVDINSGTCDYEWSDFTWLYTTEGNVAEQDINGCLVEGDNTVYFRLRNDNYHAHTHPGMQVEIDYSSEVNLNLQEVEISDRYYFDHINSTENNGDGAGAWATYPFFIPSDAQNLTVTMQVHARNVRNYNDGVHGCDIRQGNNKGYCWFYAWDGWRTADNNDVTVFLNDDTPFFIDATPSTNPTYTFTQENLSLINGTNMVAVYFNSYGDYVWGEDFVGIYSDPINDPQGSSYIEVNYTREVQIPFGMALISTVEQFGGVLDHDKTTSFSYPEEASIKGPAIANVIQRYSNEITAWADDVDPPGNIVFQSPSNRAVPSSVYIDPTNFQLNYLITNYVRTQDIGSGNDILPISSLEQQFYVPSFVGYGDVFSTQDDAVVDALARLDTATGSYLSGSGIQTNVNTIDRVPTLWGPSLIEVRVWE